MIGEKQQLHYSNSVNDEKFITKSLILRLKNRQLIRAKASLSCKHEIFYIIFSAWLLSVCDIITNKEICLVRIVFIYVYGAVLFVRSTTD